ncbi:MAG: hypothetical protein IPG22_02765 [Acidobacteria bacterium]|nr:hypothetical protein [Acidobacteriota bacterium]
MFRQQRQTTRPCEIAGLGVGERVADEKLRDAVAEAKVRLDAFADGGGIELKPVDVERVSGFRMMGSVMSV